MFLKGFEPAPFKYKQKALQLHPTLTISNDDKFADICILWKEY